MKKFLAMVLILFVSWSMLFAGGTNEKSSDTTTLRVLSFWSDTRFPTWAPSMAEFEKANPGIKIDLEMAGRDGSVQRMQTEMLSNTPPDVIVFWKFMFNEYANNGQLVDLMPYIKESGYDKDHFYAPALNWCSPKFDGHVYGVPDLIGPTLFFYNTDMFKEFGLKPPTNLAELLALAPKLKAKGVMPMVGDWQANINILDPLAKIQAQTTGLQPIRDIIAGKATFAETEGFVKAIEIFKQLVDAGLITPQSASMDEDGAISAFVANKAAIYSNKANTVVSLERIRPADFNYDVFYVPFVENPVTQYSATFGGIWSVPNKSQNPDEAWKFIEWMWSEDWQAEHISKQFSLSSVPAANAMINHTIMHEIGESVMPTLKEDSFYLIDELPGPVMDVLAARLHQLILGEIGVDAVIEHTQKALDNL